MLLVIRTLYTHTRRTGSPLSIGMTIHDFLWLLVKGFSWIITDIDEMFSLIFQILTDLPTKQEAK